MCDRAEDGANEPSNVARRYRSYHALILVFFGRKGCGSGRNFIDSIGGAHYLDVVDEDPAVRNLDEARQLRIGSIWRLSYWLSKDTTEQ